MLWNANNTYLHHPFDTETELEKAVIDCSPALFGPKRIYVDTKRRIGQKGKTQNIPDGYLIDLWSTVDPKLYLVENELARHDHLKHIAVQILEFSLSFESSPHAVKNIVKEGLAADEAAMKQCQSYAAANRMDNVDLLLERMVHGSNRFNVVVVIDEVSEELESVLMNKFKFPVEILTFERYRSTSGEYLYRFDPFLQDVGSVSEAPNAEQGTAAIDPSQIDTIVVPAREEGFNEVYLGENRWYAVRIHASMISKIKYVAAYRVAPESAITHIAPVKSIEQWRDTNKYVLNFEAPATKIGPIKLKSSGKVKAPQGPRYTSRQQLLKASTLEDVF